MNIYADTILEHYRNPQHKNSIAHPTIAHGEVNHSCGDAVNIQLKIKGDKITSIGWSGEGCAISQSAMSMLSEELIGSSVSAVEKLSAGDVYGMLCVPVGPRRVKCALLGLYATKNALRKTKGESSLGWNDMLHP